jgi:hypothetical protein
MGLRELPFVLHFQQKSIAGGSDLFRSVPKGCVVLDPAVL